MLGINRNQIGLRDIGVTVNVPNNPTARLMYYLSVVDTVLDLADIGGINRLIDYKNYDRLDDDDKKLLLHFCAVFEPDELDDKVFFHSENLGNSNNDIFELENVQTTLAVSSNILIGGARRRVLRINLYNRFWIQKNFYEPFSALKDELDRCIIL